MRQDTSRDAADQKGQPVLLRCQAHIGVDSKEGVVHWVCTSAASVSDMHMLADLLHGDEKKGWGDAGYQGQTEKIHEAAPQAQDMICRRTKKRPSETNPLYYAQRTVDVASARLWLLEGAPNERHKRNLLQV
jgi:IS5 family transposase